MLEFKTSADATDWMEKNRVSQEFRKCTNIGVSDYFLIEHAWKGL